MRNRFYKDFYFLTKKLMLNFILITGDRAIFNPTFGKAIVVVRPGILTGTGIPTINKKKICLFGDEKKVIVPGCSYTSPPNVTPGTVRSPVGWVEA
nr:hypothetical protein [Nostoc sp. DedSLP05]MDZ8101666.1 hypothetical protein [Nostoc sp. DedSLP01]